MKRLLASVILLGSLCSPASARDEEFSKVEPPPYLVTLLNKPYKDVEAFKKELLEFKSPWRELFEGVQEPKDSGFVIGSYDKPPAVEVLHNSDKALVISAVAGNFRSSFCAVVFLLTKNGNDLSVSDIIRRTDIGYSQMEKVEVCPLKPEKYIHLHLATYRGGRRQGSSSDEFFIVKDDRFQPTLALRDGLEIDPAGAPYGSFEQSAEVVPKDGALRIHMTRQWLMKEGGNKEEKFDVDFHWDARTEKWVSPDRDKIHIKNPAEWIGEKLPKPPEAQTR